MFSRRYWRNTVALAALVVLLGAGFAGRAWLKNSEEQSMALRTDPLPDKI